MNHNPTQFPDALDLVVFPGPSPPTATGTRRRFHGLVECALLVLVVVLTWMVVSAPRGAEPTESTAVGAAPVARPRLLTPDTASPGEQIVVLAYAYRRGCGPTELRFDDAPVVHRLNRYLGSPHPDWVELFMILDVPAGAYRGRHEIQLYGPANHPCGTGSTLLATVPITLGAR